MPDTFPIDKLYRTGVVVWDLKKAVRDYTEVYGIEKWCIFHQTPDRLKGASFFGRSVEHGYSSAVGETPGGAPGGQNAARPAARPLRPPLPRLHHRLHREGARIVAVRFVG